MAFITTRDNQQLYYKEWGQKQQERDKTIILIHGWPLNADSWDNIALALANSGYHVIAYDRRGFGRSSQPWLGYDYTGLSNDLADLIQQTNATNITLVGFSMGGGEVVRYMSEHDTTHIQRIALISSVVPYMLQTTDNPDGVPQEVSDGMADGIKKDRASFFKSFLKDLYDIEILSKPVSEAVIDWSWGMCMQAGLHPTLACANSFSTTDFRTELSNINVPTLLIHGTSDDIVPIELTSHKAANAIKLAELKEYKGAPHGLLVTEEYNIIKDLKIFLEA